MEYVSSGPGLFGTRLLAGSTSSLSKEGTRMNSAVLISCLMGLKRMLTGKTPQNKKKSPPAFFLIFSRMSSFKGLKT